MDEKITYQIIYIYQISPKKLMFENLLKKEILGIYISDNLIDSITFEKQGDDWVLKEHNKWEFSGFKAGLDLLEKFLTGLSPSSSRMISVSIPQKNIFFREVTLKNLSLEEAISSVKLSISAHIHLEPNDVFFDVHPFENKDEVKVVIAYSQKKNIEPIIEIFNKTRHIKSLNSISSFIPGFDTLLRIYKFPFPRVIVTKNIDSDDKGQKRIVSMHGNETWVGAHLISNEESFQSIINYLPTELQALSPTYVGYSLHHPYNKGDLLKEMTKKIINEELPLSPALCTVGLCLGKPTISFYPQYKKRFHKPGQRFYVLFLILSACLMVSLTLYDIYEYSRLRNKFLLSQQKLKQVENNLQPLMKMNNEKIELEKNYNEIMEFKTQSVSILEILKTLTETTPDHSFLRTFYYSDNRLRISVTGLSAIELMDIWRKNPMFQDVKLISTVSKERENLETFSVEISLSHTKPDASRQTDSSINTFQVMPVEY